MTESRPAPRVMKRSESSSATPGTAVPHVEEGDSKLLPEEYFEGVLSNGRRVVLREMTAMDLLFLEKSLANVGDMERSLKLAARLSCGDGRVTFEDLQRLKMKDLKVVTELLTKAGDVGEDEEDFPN